MASDFWRTLTKKTLAWNGRLAIKISDSPTLHSDTLAMPPADLL